MKTVLTFWILGTLTGCQSLPEVHRIDHSGDVQELTAKQPLEDCDWPELTEHVDPAGTKTYSMTEAGLAGLHVCRVTARANRDVAVENANAVLALKTMVNNLIIEQGVLLDMAEVKLQSTEAERQAAVRETWLTRGVALIAVVIAGL